MMDYEPFRKNLVSLIEGSGKLVKQIAVEIGIAPASISRYINAARDPDLEYVVKIAKYFGVSIDWLLGLSDSKYRTVSDEAVMFFESYQKASGSDKQVVTMLLDKYR